MIVFSPQVLFHLNISMATMIKTPVVTETLKEREARKAKREALIKRLAYLRDSYAEYIIRSFLSCINAAKGQGIGYVSVEEAYTPGKETTETGEKVYLHSATEMFWAGMDEDGSPCDPMVLDERHPKVMFLQGLLRAGQKVPDPTYLPDSLTTIDIVREQLASLGYGVQLAYSESKLSIIVIWDHEAWHKHVAMVEAKFKAAAAAAVPEPVQMSLSEFQEKKEKKSAQAKVEDEWIEAKPRRKAKKE
jgi:hypothetical protein